MNKSVRCAVIVVCLASCKSDPSVTNKTQSPSGRDVLLVQSAPNIIGNDTFAGLLTVDSHVSQNMLGGDSTFVDGSNWAQFYDMAWRRADPPQVTLNGVMLSRNTKDENPYYTPDFGIMHHWHVAPNGSGSVPAIDDSVLAPKRFRITSSRAKDTISKSAGFLLTYENPGTDSVEIRIRFDSTLSAMTSHESVHYPQSAPIVITAPTTGSYRVSSTMLASLPDAGMAQVWVSAIRTKKIVVGGRKYLLSSASRARTFCFIRP